MSRKKTARAPKPTDPTATTRKQRERERAKELGLVRVEVYVLPEHRERVREFASALGK